MRFWHLNEHDIAKVKQLGHFETAILILHNLFFFYYGYRCLELYQTIFLFVVGSYKVLYLDSSCCFLFI